MVGFGVTTMMLSLVNAGLLPQGGEPVILPLAFAYDGLIQILAGWLEYKNGNTFGMVAFLSYGAFWWWFALLIWLGSNHQLDLSAAGTTISATLILWGVFTFYMWIAAFRLNMALWWVFLTLWITCFLLGAGGLSGIGAISRAGGWVGLLCGLIAMDTSFAIVTNEAAGRSVIRVGAAFVK